MGFVHRLRGAVGAFELNSCGSNVPNLICAARRQLKATEEAPKLILNRNLKNASYLKVKS